MGDSEKTITLGDFLTNEEIQKCVDLYPDTDAIENQIIKPNMSRINKRLNQENDSRYLAYMVIYAIGQGAMNSMN